MATLDQIINKARALSPSEKRKLRQALDHELEQPASLQSRAEESAWIDRHRDEYLGHWVAIEGDTVQKKMEENHEGHYYEQAD